jgi:hypothetical protein
LPGAEFLIGLTLPSVAAPFGLFCAPTAVFRPKKSRAAAILAAGAGSNVTAVVGEFFIITIFGVLDFAVLLEPGLYFRLFYFMKDWMLKMV